MLEIRNLCKTYRPKKGVPVLAVNDISLKFPETGMVFLLGKSGSGKSTLLNLLGGLDMYDSGEILVKGQSTKNFKQSYFDSYRNTYVGFIFQEYNILEEFSVGANIALALELQGQKATNERINEILEQVDLAGYGNRKPNELSGGQKQRVAIARALVKNPRIIMADEPTGALDSATGRQILDTLKKLSEDKLVIVVSHDREFAQNYGDRIIELEDGRVISDIEYENSGDVKESKLHFFEDHIAIAADYQLTEEDRLAINHFLQDYKNGTIDMEIVGDEITSRRSKPTQEDKITWLDNQPFALIKSKLPIRNAFKIGASSLKHKKFRLVITILLSCIAFTLFGLADTFGAYKHVETCVNSIIDSEIDYVGIRQSKRIEEEDGRVYFDDWGYRFSDKELEKVTEETGVELIGVIKPRNGYLEFDNHYNWEKGFSKYYTVHATGFTGFAEVNEEVLSKIGATLVAGEYPDGSKDEILVSEYVCQTFIDADYYDYYNYVVKEQTAEIKADYEEIKQASDMVGKTLYINEKPYVISGIVDINIDWERYGVLLEEKENTSDAEMLVQYALYNELTYLKNYSFAAVAMVGEGYLDEIVEKEPKTHAVGNSSWLWFYGEDANQEQTLDISPSYLGDISEAKKAEIFWLDGEKETLADNEIIVSADVLMFWTEMGEVTGYELMEKDPKEAKEILDRYTITKQGHTLDGEPVEESNVKIVGILNTAKNGEFYSSVFLSDNLLGKFTDISDDGVYEFAVGAMPKDESQIHELVAYCYDETLDYRCELENAVTYELDMINEGLKITAKIFLYIGIGFAVFASIMLANFISTSITYKKQEIGILRAIGSRGNDVVRIFFSESFIIAMINFVLASVGVGFITHVINEAIRDSLGVLITVLTFGPRQILLILVISVFVAFVASFIPVRAIAAKRPIDAIRNR